MKIALVGSEGFFVIAFKKLWDPAEGVLELFHRGSLPWDVKGNLKDSIIYSDILIWAATSVNPKSAESDPSLVTREMQEWQRVVNQLSLHSNPPRIFFLSSGGCVYSADNYPFTENSEALGWNAYGRLKVAQENVLLESIRKPVILRFSNIYGPGQPHGRGQGVIAEWAFRSKNNMPLQLFGDSSASRDYIYIDDAISAMLSLIHSDDDGVFNIGSGYGVTLNSITEIFKQEVGTGLIIEHISGRNFDRKDYFLSINKINYSTGWKPKVDLQQGIVRVLNSDLSSV